MAENVAYLSFGLLLGAKYNHSQPKKIMAWNS